MLSCLPDGHRWHSLDVPYDVAPHSCVMVLRPVQLIRKAPELQGKASGSVHQPKTLLQV